MVLSNLEKQEFLTIRDCFEILFIGWDQSFMAGVIDEVQDRVYKRLEEVYGGADFYNEDYFPVIVFELPCLVVEELYDMKQITSYLMDELRQQATLGTAHFGTPMYPTFSINILFTNSNKRIQIRNKIWDAKYRGTNPVKYYQFLTQVEPIYGTSSWEWKDYDHRNPWELLNGIIENGNTIG